MSVADARQRREEIGRIGVDLLENTIYPTLDPADEGKFVVVDTASGEYEIDGDDLAAVKRLRERLPDAQPFLGRYGHPAAYSLRSPR